MQRKNLFAVFAPLRLKTKKGRAAARPYYFTISLYTISLLHNLHLRHLITLTNLVDHIQSFYHAAEARVVAVEVRGVGTRVADEEL
jgi:hypothetical protein